MGNFEYSLKRNESEKVLTRKFYSFWSYLGSITTTKKNTKIIHIKACFRLLTLILCVH